MTLLYRCGPSGGSGGAYVWDHDIPDDAKAKRITMMFGDRGLKCIQMHLERPDGSAYDLGRWGTPDGADQNYVVTLNENGGDEEHITGIKGSFGKTVKRVGIITSNATRGPYPPGPDDDDAPFLYRVPKGLYEIVGFVARCGTYVDALGIVYRRRQEQD